MRGMRKLGSVGVATSAAVIALTLAACTSPAPAASPTQSSRRAATPSASPSASPTTPELVYSGTARQNLPYFDLVNQRLIAKGGTPRGRDFVDSLVAAGFAKKDMQVTADTTTVGLQADNIQFSVRFNGECLIGQYGNIGYASTVQPELSTDQCLAGDTRPVDG